MHQQSYYTPKIPFTGTIKGGLREGKTITVTGRVLPGAERFNVDFQCGSDVALHFNPRYGGFGGSYVVCNTRQGSSWGREERTQPSPLPLGANFTLVFMTNHDSYSIVVNGAHFMEYKHRISASSVGNIFVNGGVEIQSIAFQNPASSHPNPVSASYRGRNKSRSNKAACAAAFAPPSFASFTMAPPPYSPSPSYIVPYKTVIQGGLYPGKTITIQGIPIQPANGFIINLRSNSGIAIHFNPRFKENTVVRNSHMDNKWGSEERSGGMPFHCGQPFTVAFVCDTQCFRIIVNSIQMFTYNHRHLSHQQTDIVEVTGDVSLSSVQV
ncbi:galectin-9-like isoform X2 [Clupea harengus]|uniref:Galectin n=1 Tax=Clupea harengus TaxID=7950 RepID=A0A8M1KEZ6_CLUHA|nr:galectin-9-like isoform X2 [Clupea harengus]